jgi:hypothetical protein
MKALKKYLNKRKSAITFLLEKQQESFTPDTFHTLRLEIKKLNALFNLVNFCAPAFSRKKTFKPFKLIFSKAGKIRELQVENALLDVPSTSDCGANYRRSLRKNLLQELNNFFLIINPSFAEKLQKKYSKIKAVLAKTTKKTAKRYVAKKRVKIERLLHKKALKKKQMHALRKSLKEYQFNQKSLKYAKKNKLLSNKNDVLALLGEWHDYQTVIQHLKKAIDSGQINPKERNRLQNSIRTFTLKSRLLYARINATLRASVFKNT